VAIDDKPVTDAQVMLGLIAALAPGQNSRFSLRRDGKAVDLAITIGKRPRPSRE
jgi:S1-C subfamily serine protease